MKSHTFRYFLVPYLVFFISGIMLVTAYQHGDAVIWMNTIQNDLLTFFFKMWTFGGDGIFYALVAIGLLIWKKRYGLIFGLVGIVHGLISWVMKQFIFKGTPRPRKYFEGQDVLNLIEGVRIHDFNSFPSGHTMSAFAIATFLALTFEKKGLSVLFLLCAVLVGISRMYLNQHFLIDVTIGSMIGVLVAVTLYKAFEGYLKEDLLTESL